ncbi:MAG: hypothetical protein R3C99_12150 [Pirellulaceae bacterium]
MRKAGSGIGAFLAAQLNGGGAIGGEGGGVMPDSAASSSSFQRGQRTKPLAQHAA